MAKHYDFDERTLLSAVSIGVPGKRTFFLVLGEKEEWVRLWLEKEQLEALGLAIDQFLDAVSKELHRYPDESESPLLSADITEGLPSAELQIDEISIGFEEEKAALDFLARLVGPQEIKGITIYRRTTLAQLKKLGELAKSICSAGRPRCKICGQPIDPSGHTCPQSN